MGFTFCHQTTKIEASYQTHTWRLPSTTSCSLEFSTFSFWLSSSSSFYTSPPFLNDFFFLTPTERPSSSVSTKMKVQGRHRNPTHLSKWLDGDELSKAHTFIYGHELVHTLLFHDRLSCKLKLAAVLVDTSNKACGFARFLLSASENKKCRSVCEDTEAERNSRGWNVCTETSASRQL